MKLAIIGSRNVTDIDIAAYLPANLTEIISGGAKGADSLAADYAREQGIPLTEFLPDYSHYGKSAPLKRNREIADCADEALAFWDGASRGTLHTIKLFEKQGKRVTVIRTDPPAKA